MNTNTNFTAQMQDTEITTLLDKLSPAPAEGEMPPPLQQRARGGKKPRSQLGGGFAKPPPPINTAINKEKMKRLKIVIPKPKLHDRVEVPPHKVPPPCLNKRNVPFQAPQK